ncbi:MAG TPA: nicotinate-nucleotide adenylyltransferase [Pyrinomonadaceae bacterium]|nr:nicotinate-nucleotide adenylyltransferase [Pyrinomonadaceae bacterium]
MWTRRAAIYGGTFDPVHNGHMTVARSVSQLFALDQLIFVPAFVPPHKRGAGISPAFHRFAMLALATEDDASFRISTIELDEPERPYAVETVARIQDQLGSDSRLFFIMGADSWVEITTWFEWEKLLRMCDQIVVTRPGYELVTSPTGPGADVRGKSEEDVSALIDGDSERHTFFTDAAILDVSATAIRAAARSGDREKLREAVPAGVANYIEKYELYQN